MRMGPWGIEVMKPTTGVAALIARLWPSGQKLSIFS